jgi:phage terminase large subunit GpA-like protein
MATAMQTSSGRVNVETLRRMMPRFSMLSRAPRLRTMREFAEQEIVIPDGPFRGFKFSVARQPHVALWFGEIDSQRWRRHVLTGPVQSGKSLIGFVIPAMFHLFECNETVILGLPSMEMARDKWEMDIEPAIRASRYRDLIPTSGTGSRGGSFESITFKNGPTLKFMSGGGSDKKRSAFTSRVLIVTETDGLDEAGDASREADPLRQLEARTASYGDKARIYLECTVSNELGRTWQELKNGSDSRIALHCPHCLKWVTPGRDALIGHQGAVDEMQAYERSAYYCPDCGEMWSEAERLQAHIEAKLLHRDQAVDETGNVVGDPPRTFTLGYRYAAPNNFFRSASEIGAAEWRAAKSDNEEAAEREQCQFVWAVPPKPSIEALVSLDARTIAQRCVQPGRGFVPEDAEVITCGIDVHKYHLEWTATAWRAGCRGHIVDYGVESVASDSMAEEMAILTALRDLRGAMLAGWNRPNVGQIPPRLVLVDSGYQPDIVYKFCGESGGLFMPSKGQGAAQRGGQYAAPKTVGGNIKHIGEHWHLAAVPTGAGWSIALVEINVDYWKTWLHERWRTALGTPGSMELFATANHMDHLGFAKHQTAEEKQVEFVAGKGEIVSWKRKSQANHWFDSTVLACCAGNIAGISLVPKQQIATVEAKAEPRTMESMFSLAGDERPYFVLDR